MARGSAPGEYRGGRRKGTPNKRATALAVRLAEEFPGRDPVLTMAAIGYGIEEPDASLELRVRCLSEVARYVHAQLRAVEVSGPGGEAIPVAMSGTIAKL